MLNLVYINIRIQIKIIHINQTPQPMYSTRTPGQTRNASYLVSDNISEIKDLKQLISMYPNERVIPQMQDLKAQYPKHRAVRGDGNCFYRAFAFLYLRQINLESYHKVFQRIDNICEGHSLSFEGTQTFQKQMQKLYNRDLKPLANYNKIERQNQLVKKFNQNIIFDKLLIMYFRSINYMFMKHNSKILSDYITDDSMVERVKKFGAESEGEQFHCIGLLTGLKIDVLIVDEISFKKQTYCGDNKDRQFTFFYRPGHYDILYHKDSMYLPTSRMSESIFQNVKSSRLSNNVNVFQSIKSSRLSNNNSCAQSLGNLQRTTSIIDELQPKQPESNNKKYFPDSYDSRSKIIFAKSSHKKVFTQQPTSIFTNDQFENQKRQSPFKDFATVRQFKNTKSNYSQGFDIFKQHTSDEQQIPKLRQQTPFDSIDRQRGVYKAWQQHSNDTWKKGKQYSIIVFFVLFVLLIAFY